MSDKQEDGDRITAIEFRQDATDKTLKHISNAVDSLVDKFGNTQPPTSFKDIVVTVATTMGLMGMLVTVIYGIVDFKTAVPIDQGKATAKKVEEQGKAQNKLLNLVSLMSAEVKAINQKVESNTGFVEEYMYREKIPSVLTSIQKDIEHLKERRRSNAKR